MGNGTVTSWFGRLSCSSAQTSLHEQPSDAVDRPEEMEDLDVNDEPPKPPDGWTRLIHPDGTPYFIHETAHLATPDNIMVSKTMDDVVRAIKEVVRDTLKRRDEATRLTAGVSVKRRNARCPELLRMIEGDIPSFDPSNPSHIPPDLKLPPECELWISLKEPPHVEKTTRWHIEIPRNFAHHFLDHNNRLLLVIPRDAKRPVERRTNHPYWESFSKRPMHRTIPSSVEDELLSALVHYASEGIMGDPETTPTSPFSVKQCEQLISLHQTLKQETSKIQGVRAWFTCVVMQKIWEARDRYDWGYNGAIDRVEPLELNTSFNWKRSIVDLCLWVFCFGAHGRYRTRLTLAHTNGGVHIRTLRMLMLGSVQEWTDSNLLATVFVSANMAFLAVPNIQGTQKTFVLMSTLFAMASIIGGVHHLWKHRPKGDTDSEETPSYLYQAIQKPSRITFTSVFLCLPLVFLLWSVISFAVALLHFAFRTNRGLPLIFLASVAGVIIFVTISVRVFFYRIWEEPEKDSIFRRAFDVHPQEALRTVWTRVRKVYGEDSPRETQPREDRKESITSRIRRVFFTSRKGQEHDLPA